LNRKDILDRYPQIWVCINLIFQIRAGHAAESNGRAGIVSNHMPESSFAFIIEKIRIPNITCFCAGIDNWIIWSFAV
jgi:hypothetical protein